MLHEASSVSRAIEKAWADAGNPTEFTIKILETGEKNFLGLSKRPAIVSITYEPKRQPVRQPDFGKSLERRVPAGAAKNIPGKLGKSPSFDTQNRVRPLPKREPTKPQPSKPVQPKGEVKEAEKNVVEQGEFFTWQEEWVVFVSGQLKELLKLWGAKQEFTTKVDKRILTITLEEHLHDNPLEERNVFVSFSYLLVQFFKRYYKKKFRGFQLIITTKKSPL